MRRGTDAKGQGQALGEEQLAIIMVDLSEGGDPRSGTGGADRTCWIAMQSNGHVVALDPPGSQMLRLAISSLSLRLHPDQPQPSPKPLPHAENYLRFYRSGCIVSAEIRSLWELVCAAPVHNGILPSLHMGGKAAAAGDARIASGAICEGVLAGHLQPVH